MSDDRPRQQGSRDRGDSHVDLALLNLSVRRPFTHVPKVVNPTLITAQSGRGHKLDVEFPSQAIPHGRLIQRLDFVQLVDLLRGEVDLLETFLLGQALAASAFEGKTEMDVAR